jgi:hypothetical protein
MGLPARQRRVLDKIETALRGSDPTLAALYSMFARLTADEEIPRLEQLRRSARLLLSNGLSGLGHFLSRLFGRLALAPRQRAAVFLPLALAMTVTVVVFAVRLSPAPRCTPVATTANGSRNSATSDLCQSPSPASIGK